MQATKKIFLVILITLCYSCKRKIPKDYFHGNWNWTSSDNKYYEVLIDNNELIGYRHSFLYSRQFKIVKDSIYIDKINNNDYDFKYKIKIINENKILLLGEQTSSIEMNKIESESFTIDNIETEADKNRFELEFTTREEAWSKKNEGM